MDGRKKGVADIEFILSVVVFLTIIAFVTFNMVSRIPLLRSEVYNEDLRARSYEISQLILFDQGEPTNWGPLTVQRIGLSTGENYVLSTSKISSLQAMCSTNAGYQNIKDLLGQDRTDVIISIINSQGVELLRCQPQITGSSSTLFQIIRFGVLDTPGNREPVVVSVSIF